MFRKFIVLAAAAALSACTAFEAPAGSADNPLNWMQQPEDPEVKVYVLEKCLGAAQGPQSTRYNDWDEAIDSCQRIASNAARYCPAGVVCEPGAVSLEQVRAVLPKETAK